MGDNFWSRVLELLEWKDISRKELAAKVGISYSSVHNGIKLNSIPSADIALKIAYELNTSIEYLVFGNNFLHESENEQAQNQTANQELFLYRKNKNLIDSIENLKPEIRDSLQDLIGKLGK